jgi:anti-sigma factor RsiW
MVNCRFVQERLSAFIDRELSNADHYLVRAHLASCDGCKAEETDLRHLKNLLTSVAVPEPSSDFEQRLVDSIHRNASPARFSPIRFAGPALVFASIAAISMVAALRFAPITQADASQPVHASQTLASDVRRDQVYEATASDPLFGAPMVTAVDYGR